MTVSSSLPPTRLARSDAASLIKHDDERTGLFGCFLDLFRSAEKKEQAGKLYQALHEHKEADFRGYRDTGFLPLVRFCLIRDLAAPEQRDAFTITQDGDTTHFRIDGKTVFKHAFPSNVIDAHAFLANKGNNGTLPATSDVKTLIDHYAAMRIQRRFRAFRTMLCQRREDAAKRGETFAKTTGSDNKTYYFNALAPKSRVVYAPGTRPQAVLKGGFKHVTGMDRRFVALAPNSPGDTFNLSGPQPALPELATLYSPTVVENRVMIVRNAGRELWEDIARNIIHGSGEFRQALLDLRALHRQGFYLTDVKPENLAFDGQRINFIDTDGHVHKSRFPAKVIHSPAYTTLTLYLGQCDTEQSPAQRESFFQTTDEYGLLMAMIGATAISPEIRDAWWNSHDPSTDLTRLGAMNDANKAHFVGWIARHGKPEHHENLVALLTHPARFALDRPAGLHLADMLKATG
ncbi:hypothetical protein [Paludibacterium paludis]|uniref:Protein kinase domain-containing protein n=1 Tax=Paludibacterium paludis TaxID=1225769 RepID=A0A918P4A7_9NEIS|nr:hypothetical protein [Paludibacterium paludis]GGY20729.1 hypothetical protein GCM10011289_25450 [Paludibacterium paludis]